MDVYRETQDPHGGSTGIGLDFVGEFRLTDESANARINNIGTSSPYIVYLYYRYSGRDPYAGQQQQ